MDAHKESTTANLCIMGLSIHPRALKELMMQRFRRMKVNKKKFPKLEINLLKRSLKKMRTLTQLMHHLLLRLSLHPRALKEPMMQHFRRMKVNKKNFPKPEINLLKRRPKKRRSLLQRQLRIKLMKFKEISDRMEPSIRTVAELSQTVASSPVPISND